MPQRLIDHGIIPALTYMGAGLIAFFSPIVWAFWVVIGLVVVDTAFGVMKAGRESIKNISSRKMFPMVTKIIAYLLLIIIAHLGHQIEPKIPFVKLCLFGVAFIEIKSIDENFRGIFGFSFIDKILSALKFVKNIKRDVDKNGNLKDQ